MITTDITLAVTLSDEDSFPVKGANDYLYRVTFLSITVQDGQAVDVHVQGRKQYKNGYGETGNQGLYGINQHPQVVFTVAKAMMLAGFRQTATV